MASSVESTIRPLAIDDRNRALDWAADLTALTMPSVSSVIAADGGILPGKSNAEATSTGAPSTPKTTIQPYRVVVPSTTNYGWIGVSPSSVQLDHAAPSAQPRIDLISAHITGGSLWTEVTTGVPGSTPTAPGGPSDAEPLWEALIATSGTITYTDRRGYTVAVGGVRPLSGADRNGVYPNELRADPSTGRIDEWINGGWVPIATPSVYSSFTPTLTYEGGAGGAVNMGTGSSAQCRYIQLGKSLKVDYMFVWGTPPFNGGTGIIHTTLPPGFTSSMLGDQRMVCHLWARSPGDPTTAPQTDWNGNGLIRPNTNIIYPMLTRSTTNAQIGLYTIALSAGVAGQGTPLVPSGFGEGGRLELHGWIEIQ